MISHEIDRDPYSRDTLYTMSVYNADSSDIYHGGINLRGEVTLTRKKTLNNYWPEDGRYEHSAEVSFLSRAKALASLASANDGGQGYATTIRPSI